MDIPPVLASAVERGRAVLFLGAGASREATTPDGRRSPSAGELGGYLSDRFLGGAHRDSPLHTIAEYAISETDLFTVQDFIKELFEALEPSPSHLLMPRFCWRAICTTNYDRLVQKAYLASPERLQDPVPFIQNGDRVDEKLRDPKGVMLLKLHGCITRIADPACPLILSIDQYVAYRRGRDRLFAHLYEFACECPIVFVGYSMNDPDVREIAMSVAATTEERPRYYAVIPSADDIVTRFWETRKITILSGTMGDFLTALEDKAPRIELRGPLARIPLPPRRVHERFRRRDAVLSKACDRFLDNDADYVKGITVSQTVAPRDFYRGISPPWSAVEQQLDVRRGIADSLLSDHFLIDEEEHEDDLELIVIKAHAGAGKTVLLQRLAWDASHEYECFCLYLRPEGILDTACLVELIQLSQERVFLFIDDLGDRIKELNALSRNIGSEGRRLTIVGAERINEWNILCDELDPLVTDEYELKYLSHKDIDALIALLERHGALGNLEHVAPQERHGALAERAGRQLLVALHEATRGSRFEDIIEDEFRNIRPREAQDMYLSICVLNRLNVPVRAGVIARMHGIGFESFRERLIAPLEKVVEARYNRVLRDYVYTARHPLIAEMVFERALGSAAEKHDAIMRCLGALNIDYSTDRRAFRQMLRANTLMELFSDHPLIESIYAKADENAGPEAYLLHQKAIYEMKRASGNLSTAANLLRRAMELTPWDSTIRHSMAELCLHRASVARTRLEEEKCLGEARGAVGGMLRDEKHSSYAYHTLVKASLRELEMEIEGEASEQTIGRMARDAEKILHEGLQRFPGSAHLLSADADFARMMSNSARAFSSLEKAFQANPKSAFIAKRLAACSRERGDTEKARSVLESAIDANPSERGLHYAYARLLIDLGERDSDLLLYHCQRACTPGDRNYHARLIYARQLFLNNELEASSKVFRELARANVSEATRNALYYDMGETFSGFVRHKEHSYCFIKRDGLGDDIYAHSVNTEAEVWEKLEQGTRVQFGIAFTFRGPNAHRAQLE